EEALAELVPLVAVVALHRRGVDPHEVLKEGTLPIDAMGESGSLRPADRLPHLLVDGWPELLRILRQPCDVVEVPRSRGTRIRQQLVDEREADELRDDIVRLRPLLERLPERNRRDARIVHASAE